MTHDGKEVAISLMVCLH